MTGINAPSGVKLQGFGYDDFQGVDSSRDPASLDTGTQQRLVTLNNGFATFRGIIMRDRGVNPRTSTPGDRTINHVAFFGRDLLAWSQQDGGGTTLVAEPNGTKAVEVFPKGATVSSTIFNNKLVFFSYNSLMQFYDGTVFTATTNQNAKPSFGVAIQRRLAIAGGIGNGTIVDISRVDDPNIFTKDEPENSTDVTKAGDIDIRNIIGTNDEIKGLGVFEKSRLAVFTNDQCVVYNISPNISNWIIDDKSSVGVGTISHNSIVTVGTDLIFAARSGIHSLRRSAENGVTIYAVPLSSNIEELYKSLLRQVVDKTDISAYYDPDYGQYHVFFPLSNGTVTRLTLTISPTSEAQNKWSTSTFLNARCGAFLGGAHVFGTNGGVFNVADYEDEVSLTPELDVTTPILWHGSITDTKQSREFILQASGQGRVIIDAYNQEGKKLSTMTVELSATKTDADSDRTFLPLSFQFNRPFHHQFKGVQFRMRTESSVGRIKIIGFAVQIEVDALPRKKGNV